MAVDFDIIVVGGGHAGVEAALAVSRMGCTAAIVTMEADKLALMSCNPAVGGIGKSHLVKEIDALGGLIGIAADATGIQFRRLNLSRGPAVWSTRVQTDRIDYNKFVVEYIADDPRVTVVEALAGEILCESGKAVGIRTEKGQVITGSAVIVATGTFLGGLIHIGSRQIRSGRMGENAAYKLSESLRSLGFEVGRLKTGTPPRLDSNTIDWSACEIQPGENPIPFFSSHSTRQPFDQTPCHLTYTTARTKEIIGANFEKSPIFSGQINSIGPRYCPSIEDKFFRFADKERHQIFLEPEGNGTSEIYPNGFATAFPEEIQIRAIRTVIGLEQVRITKPGYAIEYDYCPASQITSTLETRAISGLFFAGQINGTSGYEEAAGQGLMAGINAVLKLRGEPSLVLDRSEAYIGVMIDDLTTRSTTEPYRMFTSRAEYRLTLREDNARDRLAGYAKQYGLIPKAESNRFKRIRQQTDQLVSQLKRKRIKVSQLGKFAGRFHKVETISLEKMFQQPNISINEALDLLAASNGELVYDNEVLERAAISSRYAGYVEKQRREIDKFKKMETETIPSNFDFGTIRGLKAEAKEKLLRFRPGTLGKAGRIEGVTSGDLAVLSVYLRRHKEISE